MKRALNFIKYLIRFRSWCKALWLDAYDRVENENCNNRNSH